MKKETFEALPPPHTAAGFMVRKDLVWEGVEPGLDHAARVARSGTVREPPRLAEANNPDAPNTYRCTRDGERVVALARRVLGVDALADARALDGR